eukprot:5719260-Heterocapsa_arctica.AAC.1
MEAGVPWVKLRSSSSFLSLCPARNAMSCIEVSTAAENAPSGAPAYLVVSLGIPSNRSFGEGSA